MKDKEVSEDEDDGDLDGENETISSDETAFGLVVHHSDYDG
jgi:hypothetical protein